MPLFRNNVRPYFGLQDRWMLDSDPQAPTPLPTPASTPQNAGCSFLQLPQKPAGGGYYTYGTPGGGAGQYGVPDAISLIQNVAKSWNGTPFGVGNISLANGGKFKPHKSHRNGANIDIRPMRADGAQVPADWRKPGYDRAATRRLIDAFRASGQVQSILFNDPAIKGVAPYPKHDDHFHVNVRSACTRR